MLAACLGLACIAGFQSNASATNRADYRGFVQDRKELVQKYQPLVKAVNEAFASQIKQLGTGNNTAAIQAINDAYKAQIEGYNKQLTDNNKAKGTELDAAFKTLSDGISAAIKSGDLSGITTLANAYSTQRSAIDLKYSALNADLMKLYATANETKNTALNALKTDLPAQKATLEQQRTQALDALKTQFNSEYQAACTANCVNCNQNAQSAAWNQASASQQGNKGNGCGNLCKDRGLGRTGPGMDRKGISHFAFGKNRGASSWAAFRFCPRMGGSNPGISHVAPICK
jgi:hypothetical protein